MNQLIKEMEEFGLIIKSDLILNEDWQRVPTVEKPSSINGWYIGSPDGSVTYGDWQRDGDHRTWFANGKTELSKQDRELIRQRIEQERQKRESQNKQTAVRAKALWESAAVISPDYEYLTRKGVKPNGCRAEAEIGTMLVPLYDENYQLWNIQRILPDGKKLFLKNGRVIGCFYPIEGDKSRFYICEGFATGATIHEASGSTVLVAFNAGNLHHVTKAIIKARPDTPVTLCADNDHRTDGNPGLTKARAVAKEFDVDVVWPDNIEGTDFNDLAIEKSLDAVKARILDKRDATEGGNIRFDGKGLPYLVDEVLLPPGSNFAKLVEDLTRGQSGVCNPDMAFWCALVVLSYLAGGGYQSYQSNGLDPIHVQIAGETSDGKSTTLAAAKRFIKKCHVELLNQRSRYERKNIDVEPLMDHKTVFTDIGSGQGLQDAVLRLGNGCDVLVSIDEAGLAKKGMSDTSNESADKEFMIFRTLDRSEDYMLRVKASQEKREVVTAPHVSLVKLSTEEALKDVIKRNDYSLGKIQRYIGGPAVANNRKKPRTQVYQGRQGVECPSAEVMELLIKIIVNSGIVPPLKRESNTKCYRIDSDDGVEEYLNEVFERYVTHEDPAYRKFMENMQPVMRARAIIEDPDTPVVSMGIAKWAESVVMYSIIYFKALVGRLERSEISPEKDIENKLLATLKTCGEVQIKKLTSQVSKKYSATQYRPVLEALEGTGQIVLKNEDKTGCGQLQKWYSLPEEDE